MGRLEYTLVVWSVIAVCVFCQDVPGGYYNARYDALDVDDILNHKRLVHHYVACLLNRGPCPPQAKDLKAILPEALETQCSRCTEKQKLLALNLVTRIKNEYPRLWKELQDVYDPTGDHIRRFEASFDNNQVTGNDIGLFNRFGEVDDSENNLAGTLKPLSTSPPVQTTSTKIEPSAAPTTQNSVNIPKATTRVPSTSSFRPVMLFDVDSGIRILGTIGEIGNRVIKAGTQVADMFISTVQSIIGGN